MSDYNSIHTGSEIDKAVSDVPLKLAKVEYFGNRNILIDGEVGRINQSEFSGVWANVIIGKYGYDIWMKESDTTIKQIVEEGNFTPGAEYTLSGIGVTEQQITAPASGNWVIGGIPNTASLIQVERGAIATEFERLPYSDQLARVQRYYFEDIVTTQFTIDVSAGGFYAQPILYGSKSMKIRPSVKLYSKDKITPNSMNNSGTDYAVSVIQNVGNTNLFSIRAQSVILSTKLLDGWVKLDARL